jgi:IS605 OrfB family transposase
MKLIAQVKLLPTDEQRQYLLQTLEQTNAACNILSEYAWKQRVFGKFKLQQAMYDTLRSQTGLTAQVVIRLIAKVADAYKKDKRTIRQFREHGAIAYDDRILRWYTDKQTVSIWSVGGRLRIPYQCGERQKRLLQHQKGESDLVYSKKRDAFYLLAVCDIPDPTEQETEDAIGVDLGVVNILTDSDGDSYTSAPIERNRKRMLKLRGDLQKRGSLSAKRHLKKLSGKQRRFQRDVNHCISKRLVLKAQCTNRMIRLEDLTGINARTKVSGKTERAKRSNWSFKQLRDFVSYKARLYGVRVEKVDPRYTSQRCFVCGHIEKANRKSQSEFLCLKCGHTDHADHNAALNIAFWASVNAPIVSDVPATHTVPSQPRVQRQRQATGIYPH